MILHIYVNYNVLGDFFSTPIVEKITPEEIAKDYVQMIAGLDQDTLKKLKECDLYCLGTYDNVSGQIVPSKDFILHCGDAVSHYLKEDVKKEEASA